MTERKAVTRELADGQGVQGRHPPRSPSAKVAIREAMRTPDERDLTRVDRLVDECFRSEDYREGQAAFVEKQPPHFKGR